jgi:hypothetical protein
MRVRICTKTISSVTYLENQGCSRSLERCRVCRPNFKCRMWHIPHLQHPRFSKYVTPLTTTTFNLVLYVPTCKKSKLMLFNLIREKEKLKYLCIRCYFRLLLFKEKTVHSCGMFWKNLILSSVSLICSLLHCTTRPTNSNNFNIINITPINYIQTLVKHFDVHVQVLQFFVALF